MDHRRISNAVVSVITNGRVILSRLFIRCQDHKATTLMPVHARVVHSRYRESVKETREKRCWRRVVIRTYQVRVAQAREELALSLCSQAIEPELSMRQQSPRERERKREKTRQREQTEKKKIQLRASNRSSSVFLQYLYFYIYIYCIYSRRAYPSRRFNEAVNAPDPLV